jgi:hypothetical protein
MIPYFCVKRIEMYSQPLDKFTSSSETSLWILQGLILELKALLNNGRQ